MYKIELEFPDIIRLGEYAYYKVTDNDRDEIDPEELKMWEFIWGQIKELYKEYTRWQKVK